MYGHQGCIGGLAGTVGNQGPERYRGHQGALGDFWGYRM